MAYHIRKNDIVEVISGDHKGARGKVLRVDPSREMVVVEGINVVFRHVRPTQKNPQGGIVDKEGTVALPNVALWCEKCTAGRRSGIQVDDTGSKVRICRMCGTAFPVPAA